MPTMKAAMFLSLMTQHMLMTWLINDAIRINVVASSSDVLPQCSSLQDRCNFEDCRCADEACESIGYNFTGTVIPVLDPAVRYLQVRNEHLFKHDNSELFKHVPHVTHLSISHNSWSYFELNPAWFHSFQNLTCLDVSYNLLTVYSFEILQIIASVTTLRYLNTTESGLFIDSSIHLPTNSNLEVMTLTKSYEESNEYHTKSASDLTALCSLPNLRVLRMDGNYMERAPVSECSLAALTEFDVSDNKLIQPPQSCTWTGSVFPNLEKLFLRNNAMQVLGKRYICLPKLRVLDVSGNLIGLYTESFKLSNETFPNLRTLILNKQSIPGEIKALDDQVFRWLYLLQNLSIASHGLDYSSDSNTGSQVFWPLINLRSLNADDNNFQMVTTERFKMLFTRLSNLTFLSLNGCGLKKVSMNAFEIFPKLRELYLKNNRISRTIMPDAAFDSARKLSTLDLSANEIASVGEETFSVDMRERMALLDLSDNPFVCDCHLLWFRDWLHRDTARLGDCLEHYTCDNLGLPKKPLIQFTVVQQACLMTRETSDRIIFTCCFIIITFTLTSLLYRYRWHIRLLLYEAFRGRDDVRRQRLLENNFDYDVFVSYASEDLAWVRDRLMPELEGRLGLKLCIHERDFILGHNIVDNIAECVESSKKILMVFSNDFVRSQWCQFELTYCLRHVMDYDDALIIVCVDDVASRKMTTAMMAVLKTTTYIQWAELDEAFDAFWGRVRQALAELFDADIAV